MKISTSFLSCKKIDKAVFDIALTNTDYLHVDFIDGTYVDGKKIPFRKIKNACKNIKKRLDVHLMTNKLKKNIKRFAELNVEYITFHIEMEKDIEKYIDLVHSFGIKCGLAISPSTDIELVKPYISMIDMILVMSVVPGLGGQEFISDSVNRVKELSEYIKENEYDVIVSIDGGINDETVKNVKSYVDMVVSGSFITSSNNYQEQIDKLR